MTDMFEIELGYEPWEPSSSAKFVQSYDYWNAPLAGRIYENGQEFLFDCLEGVEAPESVWAYAVAEATGIEELAHAQDVRTKIRELMSHSLEACALVREGEGIVSISRRGDAEPISKSIEDADKLEAALLRHRDEAKFSVFVDEAIG